MNPNPLDRPVHRSVIILDRRTAPCLSNRDRMSCSLTFGLRFPTKMLFTIESFHSAEVLSRGSNGLTFLLRSNSLSLYAAKRYAELCPASRRCWISESAKSRLPSILSIIPSTKIAWSTMSFNLRLNVEAILQGVSEPVNSAQEYPPTSGHCL